MICAPRVSPQPTRQAARRQPIAEVVPRLPDYSTTPAQMNPASSNVAPPSNTTQAVIENPVLPLPQHHISPRSIDPENRRILTVSLNKDPVHGIGITTVGGENIGQLDLGVFVQSITPGSPADRDGQIQIGDRILAVCGRSLEGLNQDVAMKLIQDAPATVQLTVSQRQEQSDSPELSTTPSVTDVIPDHQLGGSHTYQSPDHHIIPGPRPPSSLASSDLELEDVLPAEALHPAGYREAPGQGPTPQREKSNDTYAQVSRLRSGTGSPPQGWWHRCLYIGHLYRNFSYHLLPFRLGKRQTSPSMYCVKPQ